uniref:Protein SAAL1 n=1 Tax=Graphocephala atropunctata TaxID=36148 RepID=A0A1B6MPX7_9HEMI
MDVNEECEMVVEVVADDEEIDFDRIKGDAIGDTVYSERFVLKTLIQLSQYKDDMWSEDLESDLCILWDMTATPAVVLFLMKHDCLSLLATLIQSTSNPRLVEILVGIMGNMCCVREARAAVSEDARLYSVLLQLLTCLDPQTLVQLSRCLQSFTWDLLREDATLAADQHWLEQQVVSGHLSSSLAFILSSSVNEELLMAILDLLNTLCGLEINDKDYSRYFSTAEMTDGMLECWNQLFRSCQEGSKFEFSNKKQEKTALHWVSVLLAFAGHEGGRDQLGRKARHINRILVLWIQEPDDGSDALLITTISLLEGLVSVFFCEEAFCKTIRIVRKTMEKNSYDSQDAEGREDLTVLSLTESFGNYCMEVLKCVDRRRLDTVLMDCCNNKSIKFFWKIVQDRDPDLVAPVSRTR